MTKFKVGDEVVCNRDVKICQADKIIPQGSIKLITHSWNGYVTIDGGNFGSYLEDYFDLYVKETPAPNGVDGDGNPKYFDESMLEDFHDC